MPARGSAAAVLFALVLFLPILVPLDAVVAQPETSPGASLCPTSLPWRDGDLPLVSGGTATRTGWALLDAEYRVGCEYERPDGRGIDLTLHWTEHKMHQLHKACEQLGFVGEGDAAGSDAFLVVSDRSQATVSFYAELGVDEEAIAGIAKGLVETLEEHAAPCTSAFVEDLGWPTCPPTLEASYTRQGVQETRTYTFLESRQDREDVLQRELSCIYEKEDGRKATAILRWKNVHQTALGRERMSDPQQVTYCEKEADLPGYDVQAGLLDVSLPSGNEGNRDEISASLAQLVADRASPCDPIVRPSSLLAGTTPSKAYGFGGYALAYDGTNDALELREALVLLHVHQGGETRVFETQTDHDGLFGFQVGDVPGEATYQVQVRFEHAPGLFTVYHEDMLDLLPTGYTTQARSVADDAVGGLVLSNIVFQAGMEAPAPVQLLDDGNTRPLANVNLSALHEAAVIYAEVQEAFAYGRDRLGVNYDFNAPEMIRVGDKQAEASYHSQEGRIGFTDEASRVASPSHPETAFHEVGHHTHLDSAISGDNSLPSRPSGNENHGGVKNADSADSVVEGLATFFAVLAKGEAANPDGKAVFTLEGASLDLQRDQHDRWREDLQAFVPDEEWDVAALLWDLMDADDEREPQDRVGWGLSRLWGNLTALGTDLRTVRDLFEGLKAQVGEPLPGPQDPPTDLDQLFINHRFYSDANGDGRWQQGEAVGYADHHGSAVDPGATWSPGADPDGVRHTPDTFDGPWLDLTLTGVEADPPRQLTMVVQDPGRETAYTVEADPATGRYPLLVPAGAEAVKLFPEIPGASSDTFTFTAGAYTSLLSTQGPGAVETATLTVQPTQLAPPSGLTATAHPEGGVALAWTPAPDTPGTVVVRGTEHPPTSPADGVVVYRGQAVTARDPAPSPLATTTYAAFTLGQAGELSQPTLATYEAPPPPLEPPGGGPEGGEDASGSQGSAGLEGEAGSGFNVPKFLLYVSLFLGGVGGLVWMKRRERREG